MITIRFNNPNSRTLTSIDLYRESVDTAIPDVPVNPPIVTLDGFTTEYVDHDTVLGQDYNYRFRVYTVGGESVMSPNIVLGDVSLYGPGEYYVTANGSDTIWNMGIITDPTELAQLPTITQLVELSGPNSEIRSWTGQWMKFKTGSDIYYTPYKSAIMIPTDEFESFMSRAYGNRDVQAGYCNYTISSSLSNADLLAVFDGRTPCKWNMVKEYNRKNATEPYAGENNTSAFMVCNITNESNGTCLQQNTTQYAPARTAYIYMTTHQSYEWYWKPIFKFNPKTARNYG